MTLISKGIKVSKICKTEREVYVFERDMPAKHGLLFSKIPYMIGKANLSILNEEERNMLLRDVQINP